MSANPVWKNGKRSSVYSIGDKIVSVSFCGKDSKTSMIGNVALTTLPISDKMISDLYSIYCKISKHS